MAQHVMPIRHGTPTRRPEPLDDEPPVADPVAGLDPEQRGGIVAALDRARRLEQTTQE